MTDMLDYALRYAARGWAVFPTHSIDDGSCTCGSASCSSPGKHPLHAGGFKNATTDPEMVRAMWGASPFANIGIATGAASDLLVVDVDQGPGKRGEEALRQLEDANGELPRSLVVRTGSGGTHIYFQAPPDDIRSSASKLGDNLDIRATGGYVIAPPSAHISGSRYEWISQGSAQAAPDWLVSATKAKNDNRGDNSGDQFLAPGSRNNDLASLAGALRRKGMDEDGIRNALRGVNATLPNPLPEHEVDGIARSVGRYPAGPMDLDDVPLSRVVASDLTDSFRYSEAHGHLRYEDGRWRKVDKVAMQEQIKSRLEAIYEAETSAGDEQHRSRARKLLSAKKVRDVLGMVISDDRILLAPDRLDQKENVLNVMNGTLDLCTGTLHPHRAEDLLTRMANVHYDIEATCPRFDAFLKETLSDEVARFAMRFLGYVLLGDPKEHVFAILYGPGRNGKSTLVEIIRWLLGDYAASTEPSTFTKRTHDERRDDIARLAGKRLVATSELGTGEILDAPMVKRLTGGETISARNLYHSRFEFQPAFTVVMTSNVRPVIDGGDTALARRIVVVHFDRVVAPEQLDTNLPRALEAESPGILNRLLEGLRDYQKQGLAIPACVRADIDQYVAQSDMIAQFLEETCEVSEGEMMGAQSLHTSYKRWCDSFGLKPLSRGVFKTEMEKRGYHQERRSGGKMWANLKRKPFETI
ncbi:phage/plasmid primase, P4 family [Albimonas sp. CAU 1670]|uniref:phage/plasmid primase, P4 family n=1 Tax=Albimonas sp. CAU 1670 TaxID=3032599 RepID=UPI0023DBBE97|nr:phage/plasmid primase, P4 family [Albimonas sp. CAU 1670]MDF2235109.1 phage/plasmid primase, P4 family [Albimonas sp. CAU 1670]